MSCRVRIGFRHKRVNWAKFLEGYQNQMGTCTKFYVNRQLFINESLELDQCFSSFTERYHNLARNIVAQIQR